MLEVCQEGDVVKLFGWYRRFFSNESCYSLADLRLLLWASGAIDSLSFGLNI